MDKNKAIKWLDEFEQGIIPEYTAENIEKVILYALWARSDKTKYKMFRQAISGIAEHIKITEVK